MLYTFVPNKPFGSLLEISPKNHTFLKTFAEFQEIKVWFTDQNSKPLEVESKTYAKKMLQKEQFKKQQKQLEI